MCNTHLHATIFLPLGLSITPQIPAFFNASNSALIAKSHFSQSILLTSLSMAGSNASASAITAAIANSMLPISTISLSIPAAPLSASPSLAVWRPLRKNGWFFHPSKMKEPLWSCLT
jgi:hypothetical protein